MLTQGVMYILKTYDNPSHPLKFSKVASNVLSYTGFKTETER